MGYKRKLLLFTSMAWDYDRSISLLHEQLYRCNGYTSSVGKQEVASSLKLADKNPRERGIFAYSDIILPIEDTALILRA